MFALPCVTCWAGGTNMFGCWFDVDVLREMNFKAYTHWKLDTNKIFIAIWNSGWISQTEILKRQAVYPLFFLEGLDSSKTDRIPTEEHLFSTFLPDSAGGYAERGLSVWKSNTGLLGKRLCSRMGQRSVYIVHVRLFYLLKHIRPRLTARGADSVVALSDHSNAQRHTWRAELFGKKKENPHKEVAREQLLTRFYIT